MLAVAVPITRTLHVINLWLTSSIFGFSRQPLAMRHQSLACVVNLWLCLTHLCDLCLPVTNLQLHAIDRWLCVINP